MQRFRSGPHIVEAVQITARIFDALHPRPKHIAGLIYDPTGPVIHVPTREGVKVGKIGDWIVKGPHGQLEIFNPDLFAATFEPVTATVLRFERRG